MGLFGLHLPKKVDNVFGGAENFAKGVAGGFVNTAQLPYDVARMGAAAVTGNRVAGQNAVQATYGDATHSLPSFAVNAAQKGIAAGFQPYAISQANQAENYANRVLGKAYNTNPITGNEITSPIWKNYFNSGVDAGQAKYGLLVGSIRQSGFAPNDTFKNNALKSTAAIGSGVANALAFGKLPGESLAAKSAISGGLFGTAAGLDTATTEAPTSKDYAKNILPAVAQGAAFPAVEAGLKSGYKSFKGSADSAAASVVAQEKALRAEIDSINKSRDKLTANNATKAELADNTRSLIDATQRFHDFQKAAKEGGGRNTVGLPENQPAQTFSPEQYAKENIAAREAAAIADKPSVIGGARKEFASKAIDALSPIEKPVTDIVGRREALPLRNALDRSLRSPTIAGQFVKDNGLASVIQTVKDPKVFDEYLAAVHARDLEANGVKTGRNLAKDQQLINTVGQEYAPHAQQIRAYSSGLLDKATEYGLISKETAAYLKEKYPNYVPFDRVFSEGELANVKGNGSGPASLSTQTVVQKIAGSDRAIQSPLESLLVKTHDLVAQGERNLAAKEIVKTMDLPGNPLSLKEIPASETIGTRSAISFIDNGIKRTFETTPEVATAAKSLNKEQLGFITKVIAQPSTRVLRLGATGINPAFALANVVKDAATAFINSEHPLRASIANPKVFVESLSASLHHGGSKYAELVREGAGGTSFDIARPEAAQTLESIRNQSSIGKHVFTTVTSPKEWLRAIEDGIGRSEEFGRAMQYFGNKSAALAEGKSLSEAKAYGADAARNNTVNFSRGGTVVRGANSYIPYLNAGVQGSRTLLRNLKERPAQTATKIALAGFAPVAAATAWNLNDPERKKIYDNISEYEKQNNVIIIPPGSKQDSSGRWNVIKIPMSQEISNLNNIVRASLESKIASKEINVAELAGNLFGATTSLNAQSPTQVVGQLTPQVAKPVVETAVNKNLFTGQQIVPDALKNLSPQDQASKSTSGTARVIGRATGTSPLMIDNAIRTSTGGVGQNLIHLSDTALNKIGAIPSDQIQGKSVGESIANRFNSAQGQTAGTLFFKSVQDEAKKQKLAGKDYELLNALTAKEIDASGSAIPQNDRDALNNNAILANNPKVAAVRAEAAKKLAAQTGRAVDPLYNLTPKQQEAYYKLNSSIYKGQAYERITKENKDWLGGFQKERIAYFDKLNLPAPETSGKVKYPLNASEKNALDSYFAISDPAKRGAALQSNPIISSSLNKLSKYANDKQIAQGSAPLDTYPGASPQIDAWTKEYFAQPKGSKVKWRKANPGKWASVSQDMISKALYGLQGEAVAAQYKDTGISQKGLKDIYNLGQYDIGKQTDANGNIFYALGGQDSSGGYAYGGKKKIGLSQTLSPISVSVSKKNQSIKKPNVRVAVKARSSGGKSARIKVTSKKLRLA